MEGVAEIYHLLTLCSYALPQSFALGRPLTQYSLSSAHNLGKQTMEAPRVLGESNQTPGYRRAEQMQPEGAVLRLQTGELHHLCPL